MELLCADDTNFSIIIIVENQIIIIVHLRPEIFESSVIATLSLDRCIISHPSKSPFWHSEDVILITSFTSVVPNLANQYAYTFLPVYLKP